MKSLACSMLACLTILGAPACAKKLDTQRESVDTGSFGSTVLTLLCKRVAYLSDRADGDGVVDVRGDEYREICRTDVLPFDGAPPALRALQAERPRLVAAIDAIGPEAFLDTLQAYVTKDEFLAIYDDGTATAAMDALAGILAAMSADRDALGAFERLGLREGYRPASAGSGAVQVALSYPDLDALLLHSVQDIAPGGSAHDELTRLFAALGATLRNATPAGDPEDPERVARLALDLLLGDESALGTGQEIWIVRRDARGLAKVLPRPGGVMPGPFTDSDGDGLADVDELGRFVGPGGQVVDAPTPFALPPGEELPEWPARDDAGRALDHGDGLPIYEYVNLDRTVLAALARDGAAIMDPELGTGIDALRGLIPLMGPRKEVTRTYDNGDSLAYAGFDTANAALLDILHGFLQLLRMPTAPGEVSIYHGMSLVRELLANHEPALARLAEALIGSARLADEFPDAELEPDSPIFDDLIPVVREIVARPGLVEDLMLAMEDPRMLAAAKRMAVFMTYAGKFSYDSVPPATQPPHDYPVIGAFDTPVNRMAPNSGLNRSIMQRVLHLLDDANGVALCNKEGAQMHLAGSPVGQPYARCELFEIEDLAVFYVRSLAYAKDGAGNVLVHPAGHPRAGQPVRAGEITFNWNDPTIAALATDSNMEILTTIRGFGANPTPEALGRTLFLDPTPEFLTHIIEPVETRHGQLFTEVHAGTLPAWELEGFLELMQPLVQPFVDHGAEHLFVDLMVALHRHWPARDSEDHQQAEPHAPGYAWAANVASYEPLIAAIIERGGLVGALTEHAQELNAVQVGGHTYPQIAAAMADFFLKQQPGLAKRDGSTATTTVDGRPVDTLSIWHVLADAYAKKRAAFDADPERAALWDRAVSQLIDVLARGAEDGITGWHFANPRMRGVGLAMVGFLEGRLAAHDLAGDRDVWLSRELPGDIEELLGGPVVAAAADLVDTMSANAEARRQLEAFTGYMLDEQTYPDAFRAMVIAIGDLVQLAALDDRDMIPLAHLAGLLVDPARGLMDPQLSFALKARLADGAGTLVQMIRNAFTEHRPGHTPVADIIDGIAEVHRAEPFEARGEPYTVADYESMLSGIAGFIEDERRGLRKFIAIIENRTVQAESAR